MQVGFTFHLVYQLKPHINAKGHVTSTKYKEQLR